MRWIFRIVAALVVLVVGAVLALFLLPADKIANLVTQQFETATGRAMTLQGDVRPTLWPEIGVNTGPVTIANASWSKAGPMLQAERLSIGVDVMALLGGAIRIKRIEADAPEILLELAKDGRANWDLSSAGSGNATTTTPASAGSGLPDISMERVQISSGQISFVDHASGSRVDVDQINASIHLPDIRGTADLQGTAAMNGQLVSLDTTIAGLEGFLTGGAVPVNADIKIGGSVIGFEGRAGMVPLAAGGRLNADLKDMAALFRLIGQTAPAVPRGFGQVVGIDGLVTLTEDFGVTLRDATIRLDQNVLAGAVDLAMGDRPRVTAKLAGGVLDFSAAMGGDAAAPASGGNAASSGWSRDRIDLSGMQAIDAEIALGADSIDLGIAKLGRASTLTRLDTGRAVTQIREMSAYGGNVTGEVVVNSRGGLSTRVTLNGAGVALQPLLQELAGYDRLLGSGDVAVNVLASGNDLNALMNSLSGEGSMRLGQGELRGLDLVGMLRHLDTSYVGAGAKTIFNSVGGTFKLDKGVLYNDDLKLLAPLLSVGGAGNIGIGAQTIDYRAVPTLLEGETNGGLKVPLMITGTWAKPKFRLDIEALAKQEFGGEVEKLKVQAEEVVKEKLETELGVKVEDLNNIEDTLKKELENRAAKGLLDLLNKN